ncbi:unnamed protein product [Caenorhabditis bovis]|uniref:Uncharacterized protein n=1 Tax=Caenorhabditis bovis TaxID=2654633 RepID=A0A8S1EHA8_9PELO|nr:unnamed protein product [Caenorhabditis bovis]
MKLFHRRLILLLMLITTAVAYPIKRASGFERLRDRLHHKRHRQHLSSIAQEPDETFEMLTDEMHRVRLEKSIAPVAPTTPSPRHHHHHHRHKHSKKNRRERNEELCQSHRNTIELNTHSHEFDPPFIVEVRCLNSPASSLFGTEQKCVKGMLRCVQQFSDVHVSRRAVGSMHWHPYTIKDHPIGCQCMWPVDKYGHQEF